MSIPRGKQRKALETRNRIQKVDFTREMSAQAVRNKIIVTFSEQEDFHGSYSHLFHHDGRFSIADDQMPTGDQFIEGALKHRGNVYLVPNSEEVSEYSLASTERGVWSMFLPYF